MQMKNKPTLIFILLLLILLIPATIYGGYIKTSAKNEKQEILHFALSSLEKQDKYVNIFLNGKVNSLNASVATAIVVYEAIKGRK